MRVPFVRASVVPGLVSALACCALATCALGCGGAPAPAAAPAPSAEASAAPSAAPVAAEDKPSDKLPSECADKGGKLCLPPAAFVKRLCAGFYPDVALAMLGKGAPWSRGFLRVKSAEAWNASGGVSSQDKLVFEEEFVLLTRREANTGGMTVSGAGGGYDVLRWDGSCASLQDDEVMLTPSPSPKAAKIPWKSLDDKVKDALLADEKILKVYTDRRKECKGATIGDVSAKCVKLDDQLSAVVIDYVRRGGNVPPPAKLP
jgi:hypothetical protein